VLCGLRNCSEIYSLPPKNVVMVIRQCDVMSVKDTKLLDLGIDSIKGHEAGIYSALQLDRSRLYSYSLT
jgi:hypothetical protein